MLQMTKEQREQLLKYLMAKPYAEVAQIVAMLASLKPVEEDKPIEEGKPEKAPNPLPNLIPALQTAVQDRFNIIADGFLNPNCFNFLAKSSAVASACRVDRHVEIIK